MRSWGLLLISAVCCLGCGGNDIQMAAKADVAGTVTLNGEPLNAPDAEIAFIAPGEAPVTLPIKEGKFEGKGPVGDVRVEVRAHKKGEPIMMDGKPFGDPVKVNYIAPEFNENSTLKANIVAAGSKDLKFDVKEKKN